MLACEVTSLQQPAARGHSMCTSPALSHWMTRLSTACRVGLEWVLHDAAPLGRVSLCRDDAHHSPHGTHITSRAEQIAGSESGHDSLATSLQTQLLSAPGLGHNGSGLMDGIQQTSALPWRAGISPHREADPPSVVQCGAVPSAGAAFHACPRTVP